jgi:hypothetical protein
MLLSLEVRKLTRYAGVSFRTAICHAGHAVNPWSGIQPGVMIQGPEFAHDMKSATTIIRLRVMVK